MSASQSSSAPVYASATSSIKTPSGILVTSSSISRLPSNTCLGLYEMVGSMRVRRSCMPCWILGFWMSMSHSTGSEQEKPSSLWSSATVKLLRVVLRRSSTRFCFMRMLFGMWRGGSRGAFACAARSRSCACVVWRRRVRDQIWGDASCRGFARRGRTG